FAWAGNLFGAECVVIWQQQEISGKGVRLCTTRGFG
ncbi:hypothetical protein E3A20_12010, partial [Planctomyces bekefii]